MGSVPEPRPLECWAALAAVLAPAGLAPSWCPSAASITSEIAPWLAFWPGGLLLGHCCLPWAPVLLPPPGVESPTFIVHDRDGPPSPRPRQTSGCCRPMGWWRLRLRLKEPGRGRAAAPEDPTLSAPKTQVWEKAHPSWLLGLSQPCHVAAPHPGLCGEPKHCLIWWHIHRGVQKLGSVLHPTASPCVPPAP